MEQTRGSRRIPSHRPLRLRCTDWADFVRSYARDISTGGMFIQTAEAPPLLSFMEIAVDLPDGETLTLEARVVHAVTAEQAGAHGTPGIGVEFQQMTPDTKQRLLALLAESAQSAARSTSGVQAVATVQRDTPVETAATLEPVSEPPPPTIDTKAERVVLNRLQAELKALTGQDEFQILGVESRVDAAGLRAAFLARSKVYHPDLFALYATPEIKQTATQVFVRIKQAYTQASDKIRQRDPATAAANLARALRPLTPRQPTSTPAPAPGRSPVPPAANNAHASAELLADARRHIAHKRYDEAQRTLERAVAQDPNHTELKTWLYTVRARRMKLAGDVPAALEQYRLVLELDNKNLEATRELRELERPSLFTGLRTRKD